MFKDMKKGALLEHRVQDYTIPLKEESKLLFKLLYKMLEQNLRTLKGFLNKYLKKEYIKELKLLVKSLVLFILKVDKIKRLYINY